MSRPARRPQTASSSTRRSPRPAHSNTGRLDTARPNTARPNTARPNTARPNTVGSELERAFAAAAASAPTGPTTFAALGVPDRLLGALGRRGILDPFPIQARTLPDALAGRDLLGRAETGSGKTLAFGLPMLARLAGTQRTPGRPRGLVLVPTRELAQQVHDTLAPLGQSVGVRLAAVYGGASMGRQIDALRRGVDVLVATPGRLLDLIQQGECSLGAASITVLDEADYMADLGFLPVVMKLLDMTPADAQRLLFSATLDNGVDRLVRGYLKDPALHAVAPAAAAIPGMDHRSFTVSAAEKVSVAAEIAGRPGRTLFFVRTKHGADRLAKQLRSTGVEAGAIHGNLAQNARTRALGAFASGHARVLVATDVAARGIHVDDVDLVVHFDPPADHKDYLHRSGRTARAGASGVVLSLLLPEQARDSVKLQSLAGVTAAAAMVAPGHPAVRELATSGRPIALTSPPPPAAAPSGARGHRSGGGSDRRPGRGRGPAGGSRRLARPVAG